MSNTSITISENKTPIIQELYENQELALQQDQINVILNQPPPLKWVKEHPYVSGHFYLPIDKVEFMLKKLFKKTRIEILREGISFNGVYVVVRVWYQDILTSEMDFHDGIGAIQLQTKKGTSPADLVNVNNGAISMAYPIAKTLAIKDACDHFGSIFGSNLNRKDYLPFSGDDKLALSVEEKRVLKLIEKATTIQEMDEISKHVNENTQTKYDEKWEQLKK
jgi:hypothetical protein